VSAQPLQTLLVEASEAGAFHLAQSDLATLQSIAGSLGLFTVTVDLAGCTGKDELLRRLADAFAFPDYFGSNWDALEECLADLEWLDSQGFVLGLDHSAALREARGEDYATLVSILEGTAEHWRERGVPFWSFIALPDADFEAL
jgi:RNAse (barnase) inhibitor barstar